MSVVRFGRIEVGEDNPVALIAEIGINHEGSVDICGAMLEAAFKAGAHLAKLQIIDADENYAPATESHALFSRSWIEPERIAGLFRFARDRGGEIFATVGDAATMEWVDRLAPAGYKISSGLLTHLPLITQAARTGRPVMMSTGMAEDASVHNAVQAARAANASGVVLLHCTSIYPAPEQELHLASIPRMADHFALPVGFSDHSLGVDAATLAAGIGAVAIEKHFTLDSRRPGFDHKLSLEPAQFVTMATAIRRAKDMRGQALKPLSDVERETAVANYRYIVARRDLTVGEIIAESNIAFLRLPIGTRRGLMPDKLAAVLDRRLRRSVARHEAIQPDDLEDSSNVPVK